MGNVEDALGRSITTKVEDGHGYLQQHHGPIAMALIGVLAYKAIKHMGSDGATPNPNAAPSSGGGLGGLLQGPLGGLLAGGAADSLLSGGLNDLLKQFQQSG
jgi:hypothetical protein